VKGFLARFPVLIVAQRDLSTPKLLTVKIVHTNALRTKEADKEFLMTQHN
jgi:hypothetical protein